MRKDTLMLQASLRHARDTGHKMVMDSLYLYGVRTITCLECDTRFEINGGVDSDHLLTVP